MPEPLHMPPTVTRRPPTVVRTHACLGRVSVVITARSAASPCAAVRPSACFALRIPASSRSSGRRRPITPVEATSTCAGSIPSSPAVARAETFASRIPSAPVQALAQPELARIACTRPPLTISRS